MPEEADWQRRARLAADALAEAKADARAKGYHPGSGARGGVKPRERDAPAPQDQAAEGGPASRVPGRRVRYGAGRPRRPWGFRRGHA